MRKKIFATTLASLILLSVCRVEAQQTGKVARIGFLDPSTASGSAVLVKAFLQEMSKLGWIEGKNIAIEYRFAEGKLDRLPDLAADLVRQQIGLTIRLNALERANKVIK
jgi:putative ABC transport system substrate-binding protein